jgi:biopolymer transport protein ExbB/TolQ
MVGGLIGIYYSFEPVGTEKTTVMANLFGKLANACVSVATGLLIGLISQVGYKYLSSRLDAVDLEMETATSDLVRQLKVYLGRPRQGPPSVDAG